MKNRSTVTNASIYLFTSIVTFILSIVTLPLYTRLLTPKEFGITALFMLFGKLIFGFINFNLHAASYRYFFQIENKEFKLLNSANLIFLFLITFIILILFIFLGDWVSYFFHDKQLTKKFFILSFISAYLDYLFLYFTTLLTAEQKAVHFSILNILNILLNLIFSLFFIIYFKLTFLGRIYGILISQIIIISLSFLYCKRLIKFTFKKYYLFKSLKFTLPMYPNMVLGLSQGYLDKSLISKINGNASLGFFTIGANFANVLKAIMDSIEKAWSPFFYKKALENTAESKEEIANKFFTLAFAYMTIGLSVIYFSDEAITLLTTKDYYPAIYIVPIYIYFYLFAIFGYLANAQLSISEKLQYLLPGAVAGALVNIILNLILISKFGPIGASFSSAFTALVSQVLIYKYGMKYFPLPIKSSDILKAYLLLIVYTLFFYIILYFNINIFLKITIKIILLITFLFIGIKLKYLNLNLLKPFILNNKIGYKLLNKLKINA